MEISKIFSANEMPRWLFAEFCNFGIEGTHVEISIYTLWHSAIERWGVYKIMRGISMPECEKQDIMSWNDMSPRAQKWIRKHLLRPENTALIYLLPWEEDNRTIGQKLLSIESGEEEEI